MARRDQRLLRDTEDKMLGGVCAGLGRYFDIDTTLVRVIFVALTVLGGGGIVAYLILWVVMDAAPAGHWDRPLPGEAPALTEEPWGGEAIERPDDAPVDLTEPVDLTGADADETAGP